MQSKIKYAFNFQRLKIPLAPMNLATPNQMPKYLCCSHLKSIEQKFNSGILFQGNLRKVTILFKNAVTAIPLPYFCF